jgi:hypothetical protein
MLALAPRKFILPRLMRPWQLISSQRQIHCQTATAMTIRREAKVEANETQIHQAIPLMKKVMAILLTISKAFMVPLPQFLPDAISQLAGPMLM